VDARSDAASNPELLSPEQVARICGLSRRAVIARSPAGNSSRRGYATG
jgi:hypothetical protein